MDGKDHPYRVHGESRVRVPILAVVPEGVPEVFLGAFHGEVVCRGEEVEEEVEEEEEEGEVVRTKK